MIIKIDLENDYWIIRFIDNNGVIILAKTKNYEVAKRKAEKFRRYLREGKLLKAEKSIEKY